jgi:tetratricopeptide (TPR) repeat protein
MRLKSSIKILVISFLPLVFSLKAAAQQHKYFDNPDQLHRESVAMFNNQQFGAAREGFKDLMGLINDQNDIRYVDAAYFAAVCAIELGLGDAASSVNHFSNKYRTSRWKSRVNFLQARVLFANRKYADALESLEKVDPSILSAEERNDYYFKRGYSNMRQDDHISALADFSKTKSEKSPFREASVYYYAHIQYLEGNFDEALSHFKEIENSRAFNKQIPVYIMQISYRKGDFEQIVEIGENVFNWSDNRRKPEIARVLADAYYQLGRYDKALDFYLNFERLSRRQISREDYYQIGISHYKIENYADAIRNFQRVTGQSDSLSQSAYYFLGASYQQTGQQNFARNAFLSAYKAGNDPVIGEDALFNYARLSIEGGPDPFNEAVAALQEYIAVNPSSERRNEAFGYVVQLYLSSRKYDAALDFLESETLRDPSLLATYAQLAFARGIELYQAKNYNQAITYLDRAAKQRHDSEMAARAVFWMADAYYQERNYTNARSNYRQFLSLPAARKLDIFPLAAYNMGYTYFTEKQYASALPSFRIFIKNPYKGKPELVYDAWLRIGDCHFINKEYSQAIEAYDQVIKAGVAESDYAFYQKAQSYGALGNFNRKISVLDDLTRNHARSAYYDDALYEMASTSLVMNDNRNAVNYFDKLVRERPRSARAKEALVKTGLIYYNNNQNDRAITTLKKVINDYPTSAEAREALNTLRIIYMEMNNLQEYFAFTEKLGFVQVSISEQDSLAFSMAENFYQEARCNDALSALNNYLGTYPSGAYLLQAHYYKSRCELRENRLETALTSLLFIINFSDNQYTDEALLDAARILYDKEDYVQANAYYARLYELTDDPSQQLESLEGKMKSSFFIHQYEEAITSARMLKNNPRRGQEQLVQAHYIMGKSLFEQKRYNDARKELEAVHTMSFGVLGAEAYYLMSAIDYENGYFEQARDQLFSLADNYSAYDYWVAKGFLLLADIYVQLDNTFQARQTLKSIIDNYRGEELRQIAIQKLETIKD